MIVTLSLVSYAGKNTQCHDSGFGTQQPKDYNREEEESMLISSRDAENGKGSPLLTKQAKGTRRSLEKQRKRPQPCQISDITNIPVLDVQVTDITQPRTKKRRTSSVKDHTPARRSTRKPRKQIVEDVCPVCDGPPFKEGEEDNWTGCDFCSRWFHKKCVKATYNKKWKCPFH